MIALNEIISNKEKFELIYKSMGKNIKLDKIISLEEEFIKLDKKSSELRSECNKLCSEIAEIVNSNSDTNDAISKINSIDKEIISKSLLAVAPTTKTELLFVALFIRMLQVGGRCACIVPDGVLFGNSKAHKAVRKELVDNHRLQAVISMPSGVFQPYSGVSTAILIFTKTNAGGTDKVWFYDMKADGYSLDQRRSEVSENDIPDIISRFHNLAEEEGRTRKEQSFLVPLQEIIDKDYDLSINKYKEVEREVVEYEQPDVIMERIDVLQSQIAEALAEFRAKYL